MKRKGGECYLWVVVVTAIVAAVIAVLPDNPGNSSSDKWLDTYSTEDLWRVLVNGFASANPDYTIDFAASRSENSVLSSQGGTVPIVLSPMPGSLGDQLRFEASIKLLADGSVAQPRLWSSRVLDAYKKLAFDAGPVEDMLAEVHGPFWATAVVWLKRPMTMAEVKTVWPGAVEKVFFPPSKRGPEALPITWSSTTTCTSRGMGECEHGLSPTAQFQRWASGLKPDDHRLLKLIGLDGGEITERALSGHVSGIMVTSDVPAIRQLEKRSAVKGVQVVEVTRMWG